MTRIPKMDRVLQARKAIEGISRRFTGRRTYAVAGTNYTPAKLVAVLQAQIDAAEKVDAARAAFRAAVRTEHAAAEQAKALIKVLKARLYAEAGLDARAWADFGWEPPKKRGPKTARGKAEGAKKGAATRARRAEARLRRS